MKKEESSSLTCMDNKKTYYIKISYERNRIASLNYR